jgi:hypothetical protein
MFTIVDVLEWSRTKPAGEGYDYGEPGECAIAQFLRETGRAANPNVGEFAWRDGGKGTLLPPHLDALVFADRDVSQRTFGALAQRIEALMVPA